MGQDGTAEDNGTSSATSEPLIVPRLAIPPKGRKRQRTSQDPEPGPSNKGPCGGRSGDSVLVPEGNSSSVNAEARPQINSPEIEVLKTSLRDATVAFESVEAKVKRLEQQLAEERQSKAEMENVHARQQTELHAAQTEITRLSDELTQRQQEMEHERADQQSQLQAAQTEVARLNRMNEIIGTIHDIINKEGHTCRPMDDGPQPQLVQAGG
ncbi:uncharacterized protein A1O9_13134 [Exophiala aquamarina CBS 119918]|uniref:Uncharacterized protein n=1 Tax=Exophiala aquamarina CBS 119918 TaxID=1182545 RepID=A0A072NSJ7_9EURO|nr:uncharacterized protein A1O9_13134 [Exophiala aquamarina CBS 119918]KEF50814.1 hypothetical protein A1O9_13134 [Exophiala aquamarina CBS 119918]